MTLTHRTTLPIIALNLSFVSETFELHHQTAMDPARGSQIVDRSDDFGHYPVQELFLLGKN
jgi:hypothetical protein